MKKRLGKASSILHQLATLLDRSLSKLSSSARPADIERLACMIHDVMSARWRNYHTSYHLIEVCAPLRDPIEILAALGHDLVYTQVDRRIHPRLEAALRGFKLNDQCEAHRTSTGADPLPAGDLSPLIFEIFGQEETSLLRPHLGGNELLSALAWCDLLSPYLKPEQLLGIALCIEATIPFRAVSSTLDLPSSRLRNRLLKMIEHHPHPSLQKLELEPAIRRSVNVGNADVCGLGYDPLGVFLNKSWQVIVEGNPIFNNPLYSARDYRMAIARMEAFFSSVIPETIFGHDGSSDSIRRYQASSRKARTNLQHGIHYLESKILELAFFDSLCALTGGDAPLLLFFGEPYSKRGQWYFPIESHLRMQIQTPVRSDPILKLLALGRSSKNAPGFDISRSPVSALIHAQLKPEQREALTVLRRKFEKGDLSPLHFLGSYPKKILIPLLKASAKIATTRSPEILALARTLSEA